jgi:hypothetical protein
MIRSKLAVLACALPLCSWSRGSAAADDASLPWKAGAAATVVTPDEPMWMAGYASRDKPSAGKAQDLFVKALALEDQTGARLVIVTCDLIGIPRELRESLVADVAHQFNLPPESLLLNASHTHCGPELRAEKAAAYELGADRVRQAEDYLRTLHERMLAVIGQALERLEPARLEYCHARCGFAMNRRLPSDSGYRNSPNPEGPVAHEVPVLIVRNTAGEIRTLLFGYACHNTTLAFYQFCGDYAGYAQQFLEADQPGATAMFLMGCGGDQNPYPRGELKHAEQHGRALANSVLAALQTPLDPIDGPLGLAVESVTLDFAPPPSRDELQQQALSDDKYKRRHAELLLEELDTSGTIRAEYDYLVQVVRFGDELLIIALAGETVVDYSLRLKQELAGPRVWVAGYSNDVFGYVPSVRVLNEGGYEAGDAFRYSAFPGPFTETVEERVISTAHETVDRARLQLLRSD